MHEGKRIGLSLSGGGYRAAAFHLGTLLKLHELNLLKDVDVLSTISGGSITGAAYCLNQENYLAFHQHFIEKLQSKNILYKILRSWSFMRLVLFALIMLAIAVYAIYSN